MLRFARGLELVRQRGQGGLDMALASVNYTAVPEAVSCELPHLDTCLFSCIAKELDFINRAVSWCEIGLSKGYPFSEYREELKSTN